MHDLYERLITDLEAQLKDNAESLEWHHKKFKEYELKVIKLKENLYDLRAIMESFI